MLPLLQQTYIIDAASYSLSLNPLDDLEEESLLMSTYYVVRNGISIMLTASLPYRRIWNYTVLAQGCEEHPLLETNELSKDALTTLHKKLIACFIMTFRHS